MTALPIASLLRPRSVAFAGVSARGGGAGAKMLASTLASGFSGTLSVIHPEAREIAGLRAFPRLADLPAVPDCIVIAVPAPAVLDVLKEASAAGVPSALVVAEGFADAGTDEGRARQQALVDFARGANMAVAGPNCMGIAARRHRFAATMANIPSSLPVGGISLVSQSGGLLNAVAELANNRGFGLNDIISIGNQAVLDISDYLGFLAGDETTSVVALIMEGVADGKRFRAAIERTSARKPIVVLKLGRSETGRAATLSHTGTLAGRHEAFAALFKQNGVALVDSLDQLLETAALFSASPLPKGGRVAMVTVSGGATSLIADAGERTGIPFAKLSAATSRRLGEILEVPPRLANPIDTVGMPRLLRGDTMTKVLAALLDDDDVDSIGLVLGMRSAGAKAHDALVEIMAGAAKARQKPMAVLSFVGNSLTGKWHGYAAAHSLPLLDTLEGGMTALKALADYADFRRKPKPAQSPALKTVPEFPRHGTLTEAESKRILGAAGLPVTREAMAASAQDAVRLWREIGSAVALKIQSPDIPHKTEAGGVYLGARSAEEVETAYDKVMTAARTACPAAKIDGVLVQEMVADGVEFILGMSYDEQFGPLIALGAGGVTVEIFKDVALRLPPLTAGDVREMLRELKASRLLEGFRGAAPSDTEALVECCVRFSEFVAATEGRLAEIDLNPVIVGEAGHGVRIADALIVTRDETARTE